MRRPVTIVLLIALVLVLAACAPAPTPTPTPKPPTATPAPPTATPVPVATATFAPPPPGSVDAGSQAWFKLPCSGCHGTKAEGLSGRKLAGAPFSFDRFKKAVREGNTPPMPAYDTGDVSDQALADLYAWLASLK